MSLRLARIAVAMMSLALAACEPPNAEPAKAAPAPASSPGTKVWMTIAGERFELEPALDPDTRFRGLSGRRSIDRNGGMLFAFRRPAPRAMVMRDCLVPIDVAFLDASGRVISHHAMPIESPRGASESPDAYARRLPSYPSVVPAQFAVELAGGRLAELGVTVGDRFVFDSRGVLARAR